MCHVHLGWECYQPGFASLRKPLSPFYSIKLRKGAAVMQASAVLLARPVFAWVQCYGLICVPVPASAVLFDDSRASAVRLDTSRNLLVTVCRIWG
jgi:hypothetical protein